MEICKMVSDRKFINIDTYFIKDKLDEHKKFFDDTLLNLDNGAYNLVNMSSEYSEFYKPNIYGSPEGVFSLFSYMLTIVLKKEYKYMFLHNFNFGIPCMARKHYPCYISTNGCTNNIPIVKTGQTYFNSLIPTTVNIDGTDFTFSGYVSNGTGHHYSYLWYSGYAYQLNGTSSPYVKYSSADNAVHLIDESDRYPNILLYLNYEILAGRKDIMSADNEIVDALAYLVFLEAKPEGEEEFNKGKANAAVNTVKNFVNNYEKKGGKNDIQWDIITLNKNIINEYKNLLNETNKIKTASSIIKPAIRGRYLASVNSFSSNIGMIVVKDSQYALENGSFLLITGVLMNLYELTEQLMEEDEIFSTVAGKLASDEAKTFVEQIDGFVEAHFYEEQKPIEYKSMEIKPKKIIKEVPQLKDPEFEINIKSENSIPTIAVMQSSSSSSKNLGGGFVRYSRR